MSPSPAYGDESKTLNSQQARQGVTLGSVRWVLFMSLGLAVIADIVLYAIYFL